MKTHTLYNSIVAFASINGKLKGKAVIFPKYIIK